jgi:hypothetical protein
VQCLKLDDWWQSERIPRVDFVKIDAEGSDADVLYGARGMLSRWRPAIAVTTYHRTGHAAEIQRYLESLKVGYRFRLKGIVAFSGVPRPVMLHARASIE